MKIVILMGIIVELLKSPTTAKTLAQKFEISQRTVYRYVEILCQSGVPIISILGKNGGLSISKNFQINHLFFTTEEIDEMINSCNNPILLQKLEFAKLTKEKNTQD